jgi:hypothetical protein
MAYINDGTIGVNLTERDTTPQFEIGETHTGSGSTWRYVKSTAAITAGDYVAIDENGNAVAGTKTLVDAGDLIGFAQIAFTTSTYGWVALNAGAADVSVRAKGSCAADTTLYTSGTAGILDDSSTSQTRIDGIVLVTAAATGTSLREIKGTWPQVGVTI